MIVKIVMYGEEIPPLFRARLNNQWPMGLKFLDFREATHPGYHRNLILGLRCQWCDFAISCVKFHNYYVCRKNIRH